ncbi:MAG: hypothetical protein Tsb0021_09960 [Chlamydiales bacterium]
MLRTIMIFLSSLSIISTLRAQEEIYIELGLYQKALELVDAKLTLIDSNEQLASLLFYKGIIYLLTKEWNESLENFNLALKHEPDKALKPKIKVGIILALLGQAENQLAQTQENQGLFSTRLFNPSLLIKEATRYLQEAYQDYCSLAYQQGYKYCYYQQTTKKLEPLLYQISARVGKAELNYLLNTISIREAIQKIQVNIDTNITLLKEWGNKQEFNGIAKDLAASFKVIKPLWQILKTRLEEIPTASRENLKLSHKSFFSAIHALEMDRPQDALLAFDRSLNLLNQVKESLPLPSPFKTALETSLKEIASALFFEKLNKEMIENLKEDFLTILQIAEETRSNTTEIKYAIKWINQSLQETTKENSKLSYLFLLASAQSLQQALMDHTFESMQDPKTHLKIAIEELEDALELTSEAQEIDSKTAEVSELLLSAQVFSLEEGQDFLNSVYLKQIKEYRDNGNPCQKLPWIHTLPLFHQGYQKAVEAKKYLSSSLEHLGHVIVLQKKALNLWKNALKSLEEESRFEKDLETQKRTEDFEGDTTPNNVDQILQTLINIEQQDRTITPSIEKNGTKVDKPW